VQGSSFQLGADEELLRRDIILNLQNVGLAADLAIFHVALPAPGTRVHGGGVPLAAACALKASVHFEEIISHFCGWLDFRSRLLELTIWLQPNEITIGR
jgi:hypothetical protein